MKMKTKTKVGLIVSISMVMLGAGMIAAAMSSVGWKITGFFTDNRVKRVVGVDEPYKSVVVNTATDLIELDYSVDNTETVVELYDNEKYYYDVYVSDDTLYIYLKDENLPVSDFVNESVMGRSVVVHLTGGEYDIVNVKTGIGAIDIKGSMYIKQLTAKTGIGDINVADNVMLGKVKAETGIGGISAPKADGLNELKTGIGNIHTPAYKDRDKNVNLDTGIGKIYGK